MSRPTRAEMRAMAESAERSAARADAAALSGDRDANNPDNSPTHRAQAAAYREGRLPGEDW